MKLKLEEKLAQKDSFEVKLEFFSPLRSSTSFSLTYIGINFQEIVGMKAQNEIFANVIPATEIFTLHRHERRANPCPLRCCRHIPMESSNFRSVIHSLTPNLSHSFNGYLAITEINKLLSLIHSFFGKNAEL